jgi:hypothetical protein
MGLLYLFIIKELIALTYHFHSTFISKDFESIPCHITFIAACNYVFNLYLKSRKKRFVVYQILTKSKRSQ